MVNPFAFLNNVFNRNARPSRKNNLARKRPLSLLLLEDRLALNTAPIFDTSTYSVSMPEGSQVGTQVRIVHATDADVGQTLTYSITNGNTNSAFAIDGSGQISVNSAVLDFETQSTYSLTVQATDDDPLNSLSATATVTVNLTDVQTFITITPSVSFNEFNSDPWYYNYTVTSSTPINRPFTLQAQTVDGTATAGSDYGAVNTSLSFFGGSSGETQTVRVPVYGDTLAEKDETFSVLLTGAGNDITIIDPTSNLPTTTAVATGTIVNDDTATFSIGDVTAIESDGTMTFTVSLSTPIDATAKVNVTFANQSTTAADFNHLPLQVTFPANSTTPQTVTVIGIDDLFAEMDETFTATLVLDPSTPLTGYAVDASRSATGTIQDNDTTVVLASVSEDVTNSAGASVTSILAGTAGAGKGLAVIDVDNSGGTWQYTTNNGATWAAFSSTTGRVDLTATARLLSNAATNKIRFVPGSNYNGTNSFVYRVWDLAGGTPGSTVNLTSPGSYGGSTHFSATTGSARLTVTPANDAPTLLYGNPFMTPVAVGNQNPAGDTVQDIAGSMIADTDVGQTKGIAIVGLIGTNTGNWEYSLDNGTNWRPVGAVGNASALMLYTSDLVRYVPKGGFTGTASFYFRAWDGSNGADHGSRAKITANGQTTPYSWITKFATVQVTNNTAPVLTAGTSTATGIPEGVTSAANSGTVVSDLLTVPLSSPTQYYVSDADYTVTQFPAAPKGIAVTSVDNTNGVWQQSTNNGVSWFDMTNVRGSVVDISSAAQVLRDTDKVRFVPNANYFGTSSITYRAWDRSTGTAGWDADLRQSLAVGGRTSFSTGTRTATITITNVNDAPVLTPTTPDLTQSSGSQSLPPGDLVSSFASPSITDADGIAVAKGIAVIGSVGDGANGFWEYSANGTTWTAIGPVSATSALLMPDSYMVRYHPTATIYFGTATITYRAWDQTSGTAGAKVTTSPNGGATAFSTAFDTANMTSANDAPVLAPGNPIMTSVTAPSPAGQQVSVLLGSSVTDSDPGSVSGIAVVAKSGANGNWEFSANGSTGWTVMGNVTATAALLLPSTYYVRFNPTVPTFVGAASLNYRAWDQTGSTAVKAGLKVSAAKTGLRTAFSTGTQTAFVRSNNAPTLATGAPALNQANGSAAPSVNQVSSVIGSSITDADASAQQGIAVTDTSGEGTANSVGTWQYSTDGFNWTAIGAVSFTSALLLRPTDYIRFLPTASSLNTAGGVTFTFKAWDQSGTTALLPSGSKVSTALSGDFYAYSSGTQTGAVKSNLAPAMPFTAVNLPSVTTNAPVAGPLVSTLIPSVTDQDAGAAQGIAVTATTGEGTSNSIGTWQYSFNGITYFSIGAVSPTSSLLLPASARIRFLPSTPTYSGTATITYRAWDQTSGVAGGYVSTVVNGDPTAFSTSTATATLRSNNAPVLQTPPSLVLTKVASANPPGQTVGSFAAPLISDADGNVTGIAVTGSVGYDGVWEYSTDGSTWNAIGTVNGDNSMLLRMTDYVRFRPTTTVFNSTTPTLTFRAWDMSAGTNLLASGTKVATNVAGDITPFSSGLVTANIFANIAPVLQTTGVSLPKVWTTSPLGTTVSSMAGAATTDADWPTDQEGIAITATTGANGTWEYSSNGGASYTAIGAVSGSSAFLLGPNDKIRFNPVAGFTGTATITYRAWDLTSGSAYQKVDTTVNGNYTSFSTDVATATVKANVAPTLVAGSNLTSVTSTSQTAGQLVSSFATGVSDADAEDFKGIAITAATSPGVNGTWQYSTDGGNTWIAVGTVSSTSALLLAPTDKIRFLATGTVAGTATLTYRAWDMSAFTDGSRVSTSTNGGFTPFSTNTVTANLLVAVP